MIDVDPFQGPPSRPRSFFGLVMPVQCFRLLLSASLLALPCLSYVWLMKTPATVCGYEPTFFNTYFCEPGKLHSWCTYEGRSGTSGKEWRDFEANTVLAFFGLSLSALLSLAVTDPGIVPAASEEELEEAKPELQPNPVEGERPLHLCRTCGIYKPNLNTHHDSVANMCIEVCASSFPSSVCSSPLLWRRISIITVIGLARP